MSNDQYAKLLGKLPQRYEDKDNDDDKPLVSAVPSSPTKVVPVHTLAPDGTKVLPTSSFAVFPAYPQLSSSQNHLHEREDGLSADITNRPIATIRLAPSIISSTFNTQSSSSIRISVDENHTSTTRRSNSSFRRSDVSDLQNAPDTGTKQLNDSIRYPIEPISPVLKKLNQYYDDENYSPSTGLLDGRSSQFSSSRSPSDWVQNLKRMFTFPAESRLQGIHTVSQAEFNDGNGNRVAYNDFSTIDWVHDVAAARKEKRELYKRHRGLINVFLRLFDQSQAWIICLCVGIITGIISAFVTISSEWLSDIKSGYCTDAFYLNRRLCCWFEEATNTLQDEGCSLWRPWSHGISATSSLYFPINYLFYVIFGTGFAAISCILVQFYGPFAAGSGIPEIKTILGGFIMRRFLNAWTLYMKCVGIVLSVASGLSMGKEGPFVHIACCIANLVGSRFPKFDGNEVRKRELLSAACAAGVAVAFGAPIGGVLFSLEEVSYYFPFKIMRLALFCAMSATLTLQVLNPFRTGALVLFQVTYDRDWHIFELPFFIILGVMGGLYGAYFIQWNVALTRERKRRKVDTLLEVIVVAFITVLISYPIPFLRESGVALVSVLFKECVDIPNDIHGLCNREVYGFTVINLLLAAGLKLLMTLFTFGIRIPAGVFVPSMAVGALVGRSLGMIIQLLQEAYPKFWFFSSCVEGKQCITPGMYAMLGAASVLSGVTRMTISLTVIMFELTGALSYVLPIMVTVTVSKFLADYVYSEGIYDALIRLNGYPYLSMHFQLPKNIDVASVMTTAEHLRVIDASTCTIQQLELLGSDDNGYHGYPIVDSLSSMQLLGYIGRAELIFALEMAKVTVNFYSADSQVCVNKTGFTCQSQVPVPRPSIPPDLSSPTMLDISSWVDHAPMTLTPRFPIELVLELFKKIGVRHVLITRNGVLLGLITKKDLLRFEWRRKRRMRLSTDASDI